MSGSVDSLPEHGRGPAGITVGVALAAWAASWIGGQMLGLVPAAFSGMPTHPLGLPWQQAVGVAIAWSALIVAVVVVSRRFGTGHPAVDYGWRVRPLDLLGIPIGVATQVLAIPLLYVPLRHLWPATFAREEVERNARDLIDHTHGAGWVLLVAILVAGAPLVEEAMYRGVLHGAFERRVATAPAVVASAALFAAIHLRPVEFPGLFVVGAVLAVCYSLTRRLGMSVLAHMAFNATALVVAHR